jgi:hypothetical protein
MNSEKAATGVASPVLGFSVGDLVTRILKYLFEGAAVAVALFLVAGKRLRLDEIGTVAVTALAVFAILDIYAPSVGSSARTGAGFGIGANLVGFPRGF